MRFGRVEEDLPLSFRRDAKELSVDAGGDGEIAVRKEGQRPDIGLLRIVEDGRFAIVRIDAIDLTVRRGAGIERAVVKRDRVNLRLRSGVDRFQIAAAETIDLPLVAGAEEMIAVRRGHLRKDERIGKGAGLRQRRTGPQLATRGDGEAFDIAGQKVFGIAHAPELRRDGKCIRCCKQRNCERKASAHSVGDSFRLKRTWPGQIAGFTSRSIFTTPSTM